ncbi:hypothetical protein CR513_59683, partial [Mucuna pruriens]
MAAHAARFSGAPLEGFDAYPTIYRTERLGRGIFGMVITVPIDVLKGKIPLFFVDRAPNIYYDWEMKVEKNLECLDFENMRNQIACDIRDMKKAHIES